MDRFRERRPTGLYFSQHSDGSTYDWDDPTISKDNGRVRLNQTIAS